MTLDEGEYDSIAEACHALLTAPDAGLSRVAIPWLHVIREHPVFLANYAEVVRPCASPVSSRLRRRIRESAALAWQLAASNCGPEPPWHGQCVPAGSIDVLFISHLLNAGQAGNANDFYFGAVPSVVTAAGHISMVALINASRRPAAEVARRWARDAAVPRIVFTESLGLAGELSLYGQLRREAARLREVDGNCILRRVGSRAAEEAMTVGARRTLRLHHQVAELVEAVKPKALVLTHEGHAWERVAFAAARSAAPGIQCIGYQHAAVFRKQFAIRQALAPQYNPDVILASGPRGQAQLQAAPALRQTEVRVLGSDRAAVFAGDAGSTGACLVIPEGLIGECRLLFAVAAECAREFPRTSFVWRLHPSLTFDDVLEHSPQLRSLPPNVQLSASSFEHDVSVCRTAFYRGSTAIIQAVGAGLTPIYLRVPGEMTIDPLYDAGPWRPVVETATELHRHVSAPALPDPAARSYCSQFFTAFDPAVLGDAVNRGSQSRGFHS